MRGGAGRINLDPNITRKKIKVGFISILHKYFNNDICVADGYVVIV